MKLKPLALLLAACPALAETPITLDEIVVTAPLMLRPLTITLDPKAAQQPMPANDGASFLKNVPGFSVIRKGGTDGDLILRGLAGSRLNVLLDGAEFHGGCGMCMDPPTAYVFPEIHDKAYAEHASRAGAMVSGYTQTARVNEPGRFIWAKMSLNFD